MDTASLQAVAAVIVPVVATGGGLRVGELLTDQAIDAAKRLGHRVHLFFGPEAPGANQQDVATALTQLLQHDPEVRKLYETVSQGIGAPSSQGPIDVRAGGNAFVQSISNSDLSGGQYGFITNEAPRRRDDEDQR